MSAVRDALVDGPITGPLVVAVTGGIGAGKSTLSGLLVGLGARLIDSDRLARQVVEPGTPGLAAVAEAFGPTVIGRDGSLDRTALAAVVFADPAARSRLEAITHPLVRTAARALTDATPPDAIVVNDIPILREVAVAASFHLVIGVGAADEVRVRRLLGRGMAEVDARARIAAQISDADRRPLCDVWLDNTGDPAGLEVAVRELWQDRLRPFADNRLAGRRAHRGAGSVGPTGPAVAGAGAAAGHQGLRCGRRVGGRTHRFDLDRRAAGQGCDRPPAGGARPRHRRPAGRALADAGFPRVPAVTRDTPRPGLQGRSPAGWEKRFHANADPGRNVNLHVRVREAANRRHALLFRDWLRDDPAARDEYLLVKRGLADDHAADPTGERYAEAKEPWFAAAAARAEAWAARTGWTLPDQP